MRIENGVERGSLPPLLPDNHSDSCWWLADSPPTARNAIVFTINTPCLLARRGAAHYVVGAHYAVNCGRRRRGPQQQQQETRVSRGDQRHKTIRDRLELN